MFVVYLCATWLHLYFKCFQSIVNVMENTTRTLGVSLPLIRASFTAFLTTLLWGTDCDFSLQAMERNRHKLSAETYGGKVGWGRLTRWTDHSHSSFVDGRQRQIGALHLPDLHGIQPHVGLGWLLHTIIGTGLWQDVFLERNERFSLCLASHVYCAK